MGHKLYLLIMIVLPLFVGSGATADLISYCFGNITMNNPGVYALFAIFGMGIGIYNTWDVVKKASSVTKRDEE